MFYFTCAVTLGCIILYRFFSKKPSILIFYGFITIFSIIHIEQSRYGTGDAISFFLLMLLILLTANGLTVEKHSLPWIYFAFFVTGTLSAVKYPLIFFSIIPLYALIRIFQHTPKKKTLFLTLIALISLCLGFAVVSPKAAFDPMYVIRASTRELGAYMDTDSSRMALLWTNILSVFTYSIFYSGIPFMPILFIISAKKRWHSDSNASNAGLLFNRILPILIVVFFLYNLTVSNLAMRSFYPFFFLTDLYVAELISAWYNNKTWKRIAVVTLTAIMTLHGTYLILLMSEKNDSTRMSELILSSVDENWSNTRVLSGQVIYADSYYDYPNLEIVDIKDKRFSTKESMELEHGELFITGARDYPAGSFQFSFLPLDFPNNPLLSKWIEFENANAQYFVGRLYPEYYYYLFGSWIHGATGNGAEFPNGAVFYRP